MWLWGQVQGKAFTLVCLALFLSLLTNPSFAITYISSCSVLDQEGETYVLTADIIDSSSSTCMKVTANNIILDCQNHLIDGSFSLNGNPSSNKYAVYSNAFNTTIKNCVITNWQTGIFLDVNADNSTVQNNTIHDLFGSSNGGSAIGIFVKSSNNEIFENKIYSLTGGQGGTGGYEGSGGAGGIATAIYLYSSQSNTIYSNDIHELTGGQGGTGGKWGSGGSGGIATAIYLYSSQSNEIYSNSISSLTGGQGGTGGQYGSGGASGVATGVYLKQTSSNNLIYNNLLNITSYAKFEGGIYQNYWNTTKKEGERIYSAGNYIGGNYYTNPSQNGYSDVCEDSDKDGFCDYAFDLISSSLCVEGVNCTNNTDFLPLSDEYVPPHFSITLIFPPDNYNTSDLTPDFKFKVTGNRLSYSCDLLINESAYGNVIAQNNTETTITANNSLSPGTYIWYISCSAQGTSNQSESRILVVILIPKLEIVLSHSSNNYGKSNSYKYSYFVENDKILALVFESGKLMSLNSSQKNISILVGDNSKVFLVFSRYLNKKRFEKSAELVSSKEYFDYGKFNFGYELSKKKIVRIVLDYPRVMFSRKIVLYPGMYEILFSYRKKENNTHVILVKIR